MNNQDYIRKAVVLSDGFHFDIASGYRWVCGGDDPPFHFEGQWNLIPDFHKQIFLDALAAQLVRQVDATSYDIDTCSDEVYVWHMNDMNDGIVNDAIEKGPDRTMNTLRAIVDSGVLESE